MSLLAILVTLCLIGVVAVLAIPAFFNRPDVTLEAACDLLVRDVRSSQNRAALRHRALTLTFHEAGWSLDEGAAGEQPYEGSPIRRDFAMDGVFEGVVIERASFGGEPRLVIGPKGLVRAGGSVDVRFQGVVRTVRIAESSGEIKLGEPRRVAPDTGP